MRLSRGLDDRTHCEMLEECDKPHVQCTASKKTARQVLAGLPANKAPAVSHAVTAFNSGFSTQPPTNPAPAPMPFLAPVPFSFDFLPFAGPSFGPVAPSLGYSDLAPPTPTASPMSPHLCGGQESSHGLRSKPSRETSLPFDILRASAEIGRLQRKIEAEEEEEEELGHQSEGLRQLKKAPPAEEQEQEQQQQQQHVSVAHEGKTKKPPVAKAAPPPQRKGMRHGQYEAHHRTDNRPRQVDRTQSQDLSRGSQCQEDTASNVSSSSLDLVGGSESVEEGAASAAVRADKLLDELATELLVKHGTAFESSLAGSGYCADRKRGRSE